MWGMTLLLHSGTLVAFTGLAQNWLRQPSVQCCRAMPEALLLGAEFMATKSV